MVKNSRKQSGSISFTVIVFIVAALLGALGFIFWKNMSQTQGTTNNTSETFCKDSKDLTAASGAFCSDEIGIKLTVPEVFYGKFEKTDNYEIFKGTVDYTTRTTAGYSDVVYSAVITRNDDFTLTVARESLRSGYVDVGHMLQGTYYDTETGLLSLATSPTQNYNSTTDSYAASGEYAVADTVPSFIVGGVRFYHGSLADAGSRIETYFAVINDSIVKIKLAHAGYMGPTENGPSTIDADQVFSDLDNAIKRIEQIP
jgi:hypothetical protein